MVTPKIDLGGIPGIAAQDCYGFWRMSGPDSNRHLIALDGLRGLAALIVVVKHTSNSVAISPELRVFLLEGPAALLFNSQGAVQLFFALSGFVLAGSLSRGSGPAHLAQFYVKRIFRIHPPYVAAVLFAWGVSFFYAPSDGGGLTTWLTRSADIHLSGSELVTASLFPGRAFGQLPVGWTLTIEMIFSLALPAMIWISRKSHWSALLALSGVALFAPAQTRALWYAIDFAIGIALYFERERLRAWFDRVPRPAIRVGIVASLILCSAPQHFLESTGVVPRDIALMGVGIAGLLCGALFVPSMAAVLSVRPVAWLGRISFSVYLTHRTILTWLAPKLIDTGSGIVDWAFLLFAVIAVSIAASAVSYYFVETAFIRLGNRVCDALAKRTETTSTRSQVADG